MLLFAVLLLSWLLRVGTLSAYCLLDKCSVSRLLVNCLYDGTLLQDAETFNFAFLRGGAFTCQAGHSAHWHNILLPGTVTVSRSCRYAVKHTDYAALCTIPLHLVCDYTQHRCLSTVSWGCLAPCTALRYLQKNCLRCSKTKLMDTGIEPHVWAWGDSMLGSIFVTDCVLICGLDSAQYLCYGKCAIHDIQLMCCR